MFCASSWARWVSNFARLSLLARIAFFCGSRKLRAKPGFTFTISPICPSFSTRWSRISSTAAMVALPSGEDVGQQRQEAGALDRLRQFALLAGGDGGDAAGHDLAPFREEAGQQANVLVVDLGGAGAGER